jgi:YNFM family putative membrane transporter
MISKGYSIRDRQFWIIVLSLGLASTFIFAALYAFQPLLPIFTEEFSISVSSASLSMSLPIVSLIAGLIVLGFLSDRKGRVLFIKFSILLTLLPFILMLITDSYWVVVLLRTIQGFMLAGVPAAALAYIGEEIEPKSSHIGTSLYISCNALGGMLGRVLTGYLSESYGWQSAILIIIAFGALVFLIVFFGLPSSKNFKPSSDSFMADLKGFSYHIKNPALLLMFGLGFLLQVTYTGVWTFLPFHLTQPPFQLSLGTISVTYFAYGFGIIGAPIASWLSNRYPLEKVITAATLVLVIGVILTLSQSLLMIIIGLCIICFGFFTAHSSSAASVNDIATHLKGSASSLYLVFYYIGVASGSTLISPLWDEWNWKGIIYFTATTPLVYLLFLNISLKKLAKNKNLTEKII